MDASVIRTVANPDFSAEAMTLTYPDDQYKVILKLPSPSRQHEVSFPTRFVIAVFLTAIAFHGLALSIWKLLPAEPFSNLLLTGVFGGFFLFMARHLWQTRRMRKQPIGDSLSFAVLAMCGAMSVLGSVHWIDHMAHHPRLWKGASQTKHAEVEHSHGNDHSQYSGESTETQSSAIAIDFVVWGLAAFLATVFLASSEHDVPETYLRQRVVSSSGKGENHVKHLILPISPPSLIPQLDDAEKLYFTDGVHRVDVDEDIDRTIRELSHFKSPICNWQQILRGVKPHSESLESIWLFGSNGDADHASPIGQQVLSFQEQAKAGSAGFVSLAIRMLRVCLPESVKLFQVSVEVPQNSGVKFHDYSAIEMTIKEIIREIHSEYPTVDEGSIVIDTTGGQKVVSIVGAHATLRGMAQFQYVDTTDPGSIHMYDVAIEDKPKTGP